MTRLQCRRYSVGTVAKLQGQEARQVGHAAVNETTSGADKRYEQQASWFPGLHTEAGTLY